MTGDGRSSLHPIPVALIAAGLLLGAVLILKVFELSAPLRLTLALLPIPASVFCILVQVRYVRCMDELKQRIQLEALAIAFSATIISLFTLWLLQIAEFFQALSAQWATWLYLMFMFFFYFLGRTIASRRYR